MNRFLRNIKYTIKKWSRIPKSTLLCIRFPFLYPRNRFTGIHYRAYWLEHLILKYKNKSTLSFSINVEGCETSVPMQLVKVTDDHSVPEFKVMHVIEVEKTLLYAYIQNNTSNVCIKNGISGDILYTLDISQFLLKKPDLEINPNYYVDNFDVYWKQQKNFVGMVITNQLVIHYNKGTKMSDMKNKMSISEMYPTLVFNKKKRFLMNILDWFYKVILQKIMVCTSYTELDAMPYGWRKAFGIQMCKDIKNALINELGYKGLFNYRISQIKEKFGSLRWYDNGGTKNIHNIIDKYEDLSYKTCINCGKPATKISQGWISPYCDDCIGDRIYTEIEKAYSWYDSESNNETEESENNE